MQESFLTQLCVNLMPHADMVARCMSRWVTDDHLRAREGDLKGADVLCDASGLASSDGRLPQGIQQRCLTVHRYRSATLLIRSQQDKPLQRGHSG